MKKKLKSKEVAGLDNLIAALNKSKEVLESGSYTVLCLADLEHQFEESFRSQLEIYEKSVVKCIDHPGILESLYGRASYVFLETLNTALGLNEINDGNMIDWHIKAVIKPEVQKHICIHRKPPVHKEEEG